MNSIEASSRVTAGAGRWLADLWRSLGLVWQAHPGYALALVVVSLIQGGMPAAQLWISKLLVDTVAEVLMASTSTPKVALVWPLLAFQASLLAAGVLLNLVRQAGQSLLGDRLQNRIALLILGKSSQLELAFFENEQFQNRLQNAYQEANQRPLEMLNQILFVLRTGVTFASAIFLLGRLHWSILPLLLLTTLPGLWVESRYGFDNYWMLRHRTPELRKQHYYGTLLTSDSWIKEIRVLGLEEYLLSLYRGLFARFHAQNRKLIFKLTLENGLASLVSTVGWLLAMGAVIRMLAARAITVGDVVLYSQAISLSQGQAQALLSGVAGLYANGLFLRNLFEFLSLPARDLTEGLAWTEAIEEIEFRSVSFAYPGSNRPALVDVSFRLQRGQSMALVGKNGAGKTTLVKLLCRLYEPTSGQILINGRDVRLYSPRSVQEQIAALFQDFGHYYLSASDNIGIGSVSRVEDLDAIERAAQKSGADAVIERLPRRYQTMLGRWFEDGMELSGGEWQKVALGRALLREGKVLILDEPTASLDAEAEFEVFRDLGRNAENGMMLLISHRFSTVRLAHEILVLEDGACVEAGSHRELMALNGRYARLFRLQAQGYELDLPARKVI